MHYFTEIYNFEICWDSEELTLKDFEDVLNQGQKQCLLNFRYDFFVAIQMKMISQMYATVLWVKISLLDLFREF